MSSIQWFADESRLSSRSDVKIKAVNYVLQSIEVDTYKWSDQPPATTSVTPQLQSWTRVTYGETGIIHLCSAVLIF
jgi:hypothetical protein